MSDLNPDAIKLVRHFRQILLWPLQLQPIRTGRAHRASAERISSAPSPSATGWPGRAAIGKGRARERGKLRADQGTQRNLQPWRSRRSDGAQPDVGGARRVDAAERSSGAGLSPFWID